MATTLAASPTSCAAPAARGAVGSPVRASGTEQGSLAFGMLLDMVLTPGADPQSLGSVAAATDAAVSPGLLFAPGAPATLAIAPPVSPGPPPDTSAAPIQGTGEPRPGLPTRRDALKGAKPAEAGENDEDKQAGSESGAVLASPAQLMSPAVQTPPAGEKHRAQAVAVPHDGSAQAAKPQSERPSLPPANPEPVAHPRAETPPVMPASPNADPSSPLRAEPASGGPASPATLGAAAPTPGHAAADRPAALAEMHEVKEPPRLAAQIAPVMVSLGQTANGTERLTVRLDPAELGRVHIQIERSHEAPPKVEITVERPETMTLLLRDQHDLHRALDQAGVPADGRTLSFQLASQDQQFPGGGQGNAEGLSFNNGNAGANGDGDGSGRARAAGTGAGERTPRPRLRPPRRRTG